MKLSDVKPGDVLIADGGFTCIKEGTELIVSEKLTVPCSHGEHSLDGQVDFEDSNQLIGLVLKP